MLEWLFGKKELTAEKTNEILHDYDYLVRRYGINGEITYNTYKFFIAEHPELKEKLDRVNGLHQFFNFEYGL